MAQLAEFTTVYYHWQCPIISDTAMAWPVIKWRKTNPNIYRAEDTKHVTHTFSL